MKKTTGTLLGTAILLAAVFFLMYLRGPVQTYREPSRLLTANTDSREPASNNHPQSHQETQPPPTPERAGNPEEPADYFKKLRGAVRSGNINAIEQARRDTEEELIQDPSRMEEFLSHLGPETDPMVLAILTEAIGRSLEMSGSTKLIEKMRQLVRSGESFTERKAAVEILSKAPGLSSKMLLDVAQASREESSRDLAITAISAMERWLNRHPDLRFEILDELAQTAHSSTEASVRGYALQRIALHRLPLPESALVVAADSLLNESNNENRTVAARILGNVTEEDRDFAFQKLNQAFHQESDLDIRRDLLAHLVRCGGSDAIETLQQIPLDHSPLAQDALDYLEVIQSGTTARAEIERRKMELAAQRGSVPE